MSRRRITGSQPPKQSAVVQVIMLKASGGSARATRTRTSAPLNTSTKIDIAEHCSFHVGEPPVYNQELGSLLSQPVNTLKPSETEVRKPNNSSISVLKPIEPSTMLNRVSFPLFRGSSGCSTNRNVQSRAIGDLLMVLVPVLLLVVVVRWL